MIKSEDASYCPIKPGLETKNLVQDVLYISETYQAPFSEQFNYHYRITEFSCYFNDVTPSLVSNTPNESSIFSWIKHKNPSQSRIDDKTSKRCRFPNKLTPRENEILAISKCGLTSKEVARKLCITDKTVEKHLENIKRKLGCNRKAQLAFIFN